MWFLSFNAESQYSCGFDKMHQERMQKDTVYKDKFLQNQKETEIFLENYRNQNQRIIPFSTGINVTFIPIAVHVIHLGEAIGVGTNLSDEVINNAFRVTNENYINSNGVGNTIIPIQFEIKSIDRYNGSAFPKYDSLGISFGANDYNETLIKTATRISNVYNVWIVSEVENGMWGGYAYFPQNDPNFSLDGSVVLAQLMSSYYIQQRNTVSHELGHALNLYHTFYNYTNCNANGFLDNDFCPDTPPHQQTECGTVNSCDSPLENSSKNYMSYCENLNPLYIFTPYQNSRTVAALNSASRSYKKMYNYALSQNSSDFLKIKDSVNITLTTSETAAPWTISNIPFWVILDKTSGKGSAVIKCVVVANSTSLQRVAKLNLNGIIYTITQAANLNINSTANFGGVISPLGNVSVSQGDDIQFTITPNKGYYLETLLVNNNIIENTTLYTFSNIQANQSIRAVFTKYPYFVATVFNSGGTISPSDTSFVFINSTRTFTITPNFGYKLDSLFIDGNPIVNTNIYTFEHINTNHTIQAKFVFDSNNLKLLINNSYGGTLSATGLISVTKKSNYSIIITPDFGYQIDSIFINNKYIVFDANVYTFYNITASYIFYVKFKRIPVNISPDNFYIETKDLSCLNVKNGTLTILSKNNNYLF
ncbi:MAG: M43 family zinc metalloprotease, partial [Sediminibacterium sp.]|nr:M43 family zinc metalloprotease [Sediminibacterium sp.]